MFGASYTTSSSGRIIEVKSLHYGDYHAFVPNPLPPPINYTGNLVERVGDARSALRGLAEVGAALPNPRHLIVPYLRIEAERSSRIEGTQATLEDLYLFDVDAETAAPASDVREVMNYFRALDYGLSDPRPVSLSLVKELHKILMTDVRGEDEDPGQLRKTQNYIAPTKVKNFDDAIYVPPPPHDLEPLLMDWERFYREDGSVTALLKIALMHYQFESIHPFGDGNGRVGRLLIVLMLRECGLLKTPLLYLSAYFERTREDYYARLRAVSERGEWSVWLDYFLEAVVAQAEDAIERSHAILDLQQNYMNMVKNASRSMNLMKVLDIVFDRMFLRTSDIVHQLEVTQVAAMNYIRALEGLKIVEEITGHYNHRVYRATKLFALLRSP